MRIKSYFAPSVQAAIALARKEFGDGVTLVTSHVASLDNRHLGEYEVVFAIEEVIQDEVIETPAPEPAPVFNQILQQALQTPPPMHQDVDSKLEDIHSSLIALGLEAALVRSFMTMLKAVVPAAGPASSVTIEEPVVQESVVEESVVEEPAVAESVEPVLPPSPPPIAIVVEEELQPAKPKITVIKPAPAKPEPEPVKSEPVKPEPLPAAAPAPRPFLSLFEAARPEPRFSAAELAFISSVSSPKEQKA